MSSLWFVFTFFTIVVRTSALDPHYPGGTAGFVASYPGVRCDGSLVGAPAMSGGDVERPLVELVQHELELRKEVAVGDVVHGELDGSPGISFHGEPFAWRAELKR